MVQNWQVNPENGDQKPLLQHLDKEIQHEIKNQIVDMFNENLTERTLAMYTQMFKLDNDLTLVQIYMQKYNQSPDK